MSSIKSTDGLEIYYEHIKGQKDKPTLFFIHGWAVDWTFFKEMIHYFQDKKYNILYLDLRGHGKSDSPTSLKEACLKLLVEDLKIILTKEKIEKIILLGHSMGGMISLMFSLKYPEMVDKLVIMNSSYQSPLKSPMFKILKQDKERAKKIVISVLNNTKSNKTQKDLDFSKMNRMLDVNIFAKAVTQTSVHNCFLFIDAMVDYDIENKINNIKTSTLIINSDKDQFFTVQSSQEMAKMIPNSVCRIFKGTHSLPIKKSELLSKEIELFIK